MIAILNDNLGRINETCLRHNVKSLHAFGSVCSDQFNSSSDIDLLISFHAMDYGDYADSYFSIADELESIFERRVDLITDKSLSNPYFIESLNATKTCLYGQ